MPLGNVKSQPKEQHNPNALDYESIMRTMLIKRLACLSLLALFPVCQAWIDTGHFIVARIADRELKPAVRRRIETLLKVNGSGDAATFVGSGPWADDNRNKTTGKWHYINFHFRTDGKKTTNKPEEENVVWAIRRFSGVLKNPDATDADKADAIRYLVHFVADCHQPLHTVARDTDQFPNGDRGGNDFKLGPVPLKPKPRNLHFLWDIGGGLLDRVERPLGKSSFQAIDKYVSDLLKKYPAPEKEVKIQDPNAWAKEGLELAKTVVYKLDENTSPNAAYLAKCREVSGQRLVLAGKRLALLLNRIVK